MQRSTQVLVLVSDDLTHCSPHTRDLSLETPAGDAYRRSPGGALAAMQQLAEDMSN